MKQPKCSVASRHQHAALLKHSLRSATRKPIVFMGILLSPLLLVLFLAALWSGLTDVSNELREVESNRCSSYNAYGQPSSPKNAPCVSLLFAPADDPVVDGIMTVLSSHTGFTVGGPQGYPGTRTSPPPDILAFSSADAVATWMHDHISTLVDFVVIFDLPSGLDGAASYAGNVTYSVWLNSTTVTNAALAGADPHWTAIGVPGRAMAWQKEIDAAIMQYSLQIAQQRQRAASGVDESVRREGTLHDVRPHLRVSKEGQGSDSSDPAKDSFLSVRMAAFSDWEPGTSSTGVGGSSSAAGAGQDMMLLAGAAFLCTGCAMSAALLASLPFMEIQAGLKDYLSSNGLLESAYWSTWLTLCLPIAVVVSLILPVIAKATPLLLFTRVDYTVVALVFLLGIVSLASQALCCVAFCTPTRLPINLPACVVVLGTLAVTLLAAGANGYPLMYAPSTSPALSLFMYVWPGIHMGRFLQTVISIVYTGSPPALGPPASSTAYLPINVTGIASVKAVDAGGADSTGGPAPSFHWSDLFAQPPAIVVYTHGDQAILWTDLSPGLDLCMMLVLTVVYLAGAIYFGHLQSRPFTPGALKATRRYHALFLCDPRYWSGRGESATHACRRARRAGTTVALAAQRLSKQECSLRVAGLSVASVLKSVDFTVRAGQLLAVVDPHRSASSALIDAISGRVGVTAGAAYVHGKTVTSEASSNRACMAGLVGTSPADGMLWPDLTPAQIIRLHARIKGEPALQAEATVRSLVTLAGLNSCGRKMVRDLSACERQRLRLSLAFVGHPPVVVLDQPTDTLDQQASAQMWAALSALRMNKPDTIVVVACSRPSEAEYYADSVVLLSKGRIVAHGTVHDVLAEHGYGCSVQVLCATHDASGIQAALQSVAPSATVYLSGTVHARSPARYTPPNAGMDSGMPLDHEPTAQHSSRMSIRVEDPVAHVYAVFPVSAAHAVPSVLTWLRAHSDATFRHGMHQEAPGQHTAERESAVSGAETEVESEEGVFSVATPMPSSVPVLPVGVAPARMCRERPLVQHWSMVHCTLEEVYDSLTRPLHCTSRTGLQSSSFTDLDIDGAHEVRGIGHSSPAMQRLELVRAASALSSATSADSRVDNTNVHAQLNVSRASIAGFGAALVSLPSWSQPIPPLHRPLLARSVDLFSPASTVSSRIATLAAPVWGMLRSPSALSTHVAGSMAEHEEEREGVDRGLEMTLLSPSTVPRPALLFPLELVQQAHRERGVDDVMPTLHTPTTVSAPAGEGEVEPISHGARHHKADRPCLYRPAGLAEGTSAVDEGGPSGSPPRVPFSTVHISPAPAQPSAEVQFNRMLFSSLMVSHTIQQGGSHTAETQQPLLPSACGQMLSKTIEESPLLMHGLDCSPHPAGTRAKVASFATALQRFVGQTTAIVRLRLQLHWTVGFAVRTSLAVGLGALLIALSAPASSPPALTACPGGFYVDNTTFGLCDREIFVQYMTGAIARTPFRPFPASQSSASQAANTTVFTASVSVEGPASTALRGTSDTANHAALAARLYNPYCPTQTAGVDTCAVGSRADIWPLSVDESVRREGTLHDVRPHLRVSKEGQGSDSSDPAKDSFLSVDWVQTRTVTATVRAPNATRKSSPVVWHYTLPMQAPDGHGILPLTSWDLFGPSAGSVVKDGNGSVSWPWVATFRPAADVGTFAQNGAADLDGAVSAAMSTVYSRASLVNNGSCSELQEGVYAGGGETGQGLFYAWQWTDGTEKDTASEWLEAHIPSVGLSLRVADTGSPPSSSSLAPGALRSSAGTGAGMGGGPLLSYDLLLWAAQCAETQGVLGWCPTRGNSYTWASSKAVLSDDPTDGSCYTHGLSPPTDWPWFGPFQAPAGMPGPTAMNAVHTAWYRTLIAQQGLTSSLPSPSIMTSYVVMPTVSWAAQGPGASTATFATLLWPLFTLMLLPAQGAFFLAQEKSTGRFALLQRHGLLRLPYFVGSYLYALLLGCIARAVYIVVGLLMGNGAFKLADAGLWIVLTVVAAHEQAGVALLLGSLFQDPWVATAVSASITVAVAICAYFVETFARPFPRALIWTPLTAGARAASQALRYGGSLLEPTEELAAALGASCLYGCLAFLLALAWHRVAPPVLLDGSSSPSALGRGEKSLRVRDTCFRLLCSLRSAKQSLNVDNQQLQEDQAPIHSGRVAIVHTDATPLYLPVTLSSAVVAGAGVAGGWGVLTGHDVTCLVPDLTVQQHLHLLAAIKRIPAADAAVQAALECAGLPARLLPVPTRLLSPGLQRRLCLAMALLGSPASLYVEEPTVGMTTQGSKEFFASARAYLSGLDPCERSTVSTDAQVQRSIVLVTRDRKDAGALLCRAVYSVKGRTLEPMSESGAYRRRYAVTLRRSAPVESHARPPRDAALLALLRASVCPNVSIRSSSCTNVHVQVTPPEEESWTAADVYSALCTEEIRAAGVSSWTVVTLACS